MNVEKVAKTALRIAALKDVTAEELPKNTGWGIRICETEDGGKVLLWECGCPGMYFQCLWLGAEQRRQSGFQGSEMDYLLYCLCDILDEMGKYDAGCRALGITDEQAFKARMDCFSDVLPVMRHLSRQPRISSMTDTPDAKLQMMLG